MDSEPILTEEQKQDFVDKANLTNEGGPTFFDPSHLDKIEVKETPEQELRRWQAAFGSDNLAHILLERNEMISLLRSYSDFHKDGPLLSRIEDFLKGIK